MEEDTGHELDGGTNSFAGQTGMHDAGARYNMGALGRWNGTDPLADDFPAWSAYAYSYNNPIGFMDPTGMAPCDTPECQYWQAVGAELRAEWNGVKARVRSQIPTAEQIDDVKQRADDVSTYAAGVGAGALGYSLATGIDPTDVGSVPTSTVAFAVSDLSDAAGFLISIQQFTTGDVEGEEVVFRGASALFSFITGSMAREAAQQFDAGEQFQGLVEFFSGEGATFVLEERHDQVKEDVEAREARENNNEEGLDQQDKDHDHE